MARKKVTGKDMLRNAMEKLNGPKSARKHRAAQPFGRSDQFNSGAMSTGRAAISAGLKNGSVNFEPHQAGDNTGFGEFIQKKTGDLVADKPRGMFARKGKKTQKGKNDNDADDKARKRKRAKKHRSIKPIEAGKPDTNARGRYAKKGKKFAHKGHTHKSRKAMKSC